jgi:hypothetical protein
MKLDRCSISIKFDNIKLGRQNVRPVQSFTTLKLDNMKLDNMKLDNTKLDNMKLDNMKLDNI